MQDAPTPPSRPPARLLSAEERDATIARLSAAFSRDVLSVDEYERRVGEAYRVSTAVALAELTADLPAARAQTAPDASRSSLPRTVTAVLGSVERGGRVHVPPHLDVDAFFGNVEMDLREATFGGGVTMITVRAVFGNVEVRLPEHVTVESEGGALLGSFAARPSRGEPLPAGTARHRLRVTGMAILGNVDFFGGERS